MPFPILKGPFPWFGGMPFPIGRHTTQRLDSFVDAVAGKRLTYKRLCR